VTDSGPDHSKRFRASVALGRDTIASGEGSSKKQAEVAAALAAWAILQRPQR
jgi:ribonuclease-3